ncbi:hypothetical protein ABZ722_30645, partial [Streptomyces longwoodensis]
QPIGEPLAGHTDWVTAVACTDVDGTPVAVTGGYDDMVRVWDLATGQPFAGHTGSVAAVACTVLDGRPVAVTGGHDGRVRVWDLASGQPIGEPLAGHTGVTAMACTDLNGTPVAVAGDQDGTVQVWDLVTGDGTVHALHAALSVHTVVWTADDLVLVGAGSQLVLYQRR